MEPSIGLHYQVLAYIIAVIVSLLLMVFVTVLCACHQGTDKSLDRGDGETQPLLNSCTHQESRDKRDEVPQVRIIAKYKAKHDAQSDESGLVTGCDQQYTSVSFDVDLEGQASSLNTIKSHTSTSTTEKIVSQDNREPVSTSVQVPSSTKEQQDTTKSSGDQLLISTSVQVNPSAPKVCSEPQILHGSTGADHHNSGKKLTTNQEEVKSKDSMPMPNASDLTSNDIQKVRNQIWEARVKWFDIGIELGINVNDLKAIKNGANHHDIDNCFTDMLLIWLQQTGATWEALAKALRSKPVGYALLASLITSDISASAGRRTVGCETTVSDQCTSSMRKSDEGGIGFNCGCSISCTLVDYLNGECPSSSKLFPFLDINNLTENERDELEGKLRMESTAIVTEFANLTECIKKSLADRDIKPEAIVSSVLGIAPSDLSTFPILETLDVEKVTSICSIIIHLQQNSYISFFNYHIVEHLIKIYGTEDDQTMLEKYMTRFHDFCRRSVFEVPHHIHGQPPKNSKQLAIKVIPKNQLSMLSLADAKNVQLKVAKMLGLRNCGSLPLLEISKGCVKLIFALPKIILEFVKPKLGTLSNIETGKYSIHILCAPPGKPFATDITSDSVTLQWAKPEYEGTHPLTNYLVYYRSVNGPWKRGNVTYTDVSNEHVIVKDLSYKDEASPFVFKVKAVSKSGTTVESRESDPIQLSTPLSELESRLKLDWKKKSAMPFGISAYPQVAVLKEKVYIGGGNTPTDKERHVIIVYDPLKDTYVKLPPYTHKYFAMAVVGDKLVLIGGEQDKKPEFTNQLGVWNSESLKWTHPLPPMSTACKCPSVTTYKSRWLVVIGGYNTNGALSRVEILDISSQLWFNSAPMLAPCYQVSLATIGNMCYLMGGLIDNATYSKRVYEVHIDCLISQSPDTSSTHSPWKMLPDTPGTQATALTLNGALLAVGGMGADMYMYQPSSKSWINTGRLRIGRSACACTVLSNGDVFVAGGGEMKVAGDSGTIDHSHDTDQKVDISTLK